MSTENGFEGLCERAVADPASITRAEKNEIYGWPSPDEEDSLFIAKTGGDRTQFIAKAVAHPEQLSCYDTDVLMDHRGITLERNRPRGRPPVPEWDPLRNKAISTLRSFDVQEKQARTAAVHRLIALNRELADEAKKHWQQQDQRAKRKTPTPWIKEMLDRGLLMNSRDCWGFVVFQTGCYKENDDKVAWQRFQDYFVKTGEQVLQEWHSGSLIWPTFKVIWNSDEAQLDGADTETLRRRFDEMSKTGQLPAGIRTNCFLVAGESAIKSEGVKMPYDQQSLLMMPQLERPIVYLQAVRPYYEASTTSMGLLQKQQHTGQTQPIMEHPEIAGFKGEVTIALPKVFDYLHCACFSEQGPTGWKDLEKRDGWTAISNATKNPAEWHLFDGASSGISY